MDASKFTRDRATVQKCGAAGDRITLSSAVPPGLRRPALLRELLKIRLRALLYPRLTSRWLRLLNSDPSFAEYVDRCPRFVYRVYRPYISLALGRDQRLVAIDAHYRFIFHRGLRSVVSHASVGPELLTEVSGKNGLLYQIQLRAMNELDREGELVLQLACEEQVLCSIAFTVAPRDGVSAVSIGCLQGGKASDAREAIQRATRELHGMRPKHLMVRLIQVLGHSFGCERMVLVSNRNRVIYKALRHGRVLADYDQLWEELGARRRPDGDFEMDCVLLAPPDIAQVLSKKRAEAKRRFTLLTHLASSVASALRPRANAG